MAPFQTERWTDATDEVLELLFGTVSRADRRELLAPWIKPSTSMSPRDAASGILVCVDRQGSPVGAMLTIASAGRVTLAWPPRTRASLSTKDERQAVQSMLEAALQIGRDHHSRFVQLLGDEVSPLLDQSLRSAGFFHLTQLVYARRAIDPGEALPPPVSNVEFVPYAPELRSDLLTILQQSYEASLDCPELTGLRSVEDVFESHRREGDFDPSRWFLVRREGAWVGCLLLSAEKGKGSLEVTYVAVLPAARGFGLGRVLTSHAIRQAQKEGFQAVVLAVDGRNMPALAMYEDVGFVPWDLREVYLYVIDPADGRFDRSARS